MNVAPCLLFLTYGQKEGARRSLRLVRQPDESGVGVVCLSSGTKQAFYTFKEVPCEIGGRGFVMHRLGLGELYHVRIGRPEDRSCECLGFLAHGMCKHVLALTALVDHSPAP